MDTEEERDALLSKVEDQLLTSARIPHSSRMELCDQLERICREYGVYTSFFHETSQLIMQPGNVRVSWPYKDIPESSVQTLSHHVLALYEAKHGFDGMLPGVLYQLGTPTWVGVPDSFPEGRRGRDKRSVFLRALVERETMRTPNDDDAPVWLYRDWRNPNDVYSVVLVPPSSSPGEIQLTIETTDNTGALTWKILTDEVPMRIQERWPLRLVDLIAVLVMILTRRAPVNYAPVCENYPSPPSVAGVIERKL